MNTKSEIIWLVCLFNQIGIWNSVLICQLILAEQDIL